METIVTLYTGHPVNIRQKPVKLTWDALSVQYSSTEIYNLLQDQSVTADVSDGTDTSSNSCNLRLFLFLTPILCHFKSVLYLQITVHN